MLEILFKVFTYMLALYGAVFLIIGVMNAIRKRFDVENCDVKFVLILKNQEENIEGIVRGIYIGEYLKKTVTLENLTIIDMGSTDETIKILEKLKRDYQCLNVLTWDEKEKIFEYFRK